MLFSNIALVATTLATTSRAAFFYVPSYMCDLDGSCAESKRSVEADVQPPTLNLVQRVPQNDKPRDIQRIAEGLRRKHRRKTAPQATPIEDTAVVKRTNTHSVVTAATPSQTNSAGVDQDGTDYSYFVQVGLGSANTPVYLLLDTGAGSTWVMGTSCKSGPCASHDTFGSSDSTTFKDLSTPFSIAYGSGAVNGSLGTDSLTIAGMKFTATIGIASSVSDQFNSFPIDGIMGLSLDQDGGQSFWSTLAASKALKANLFGLSLNRNSDGANNGEINFGAPDTSRYNGDLTYFSCQENDSDDWAIQINNVAYGSTSTGISSNAYIDTGTSFIFAPPAEAATLHASIPGAATSDNSTYTVPCSTTTPLVFTFGTSSYSVSSKDWVSASSNGVCTSNVYGMSVVDETSWLVGDTFLKNVYAVFDYDNKRIGFAQAKAASSASSTGGSPISTVSTMSSLAVNMASSTASSTPITASGTKSDASSSGSSTATSTGPSVTSGATTTGTPGLVSPHGNVQSSTTAGTKATGTSAGASASATGHSGATLIKPSSCLALIAAGSLLTLLL